MGYKAVIVMSLAVALFPFPAAGLAAQPAASAQEAQEAQVAQVAQAAESYVPDGPVSTTVTGDVIPGGHVTVTFTDGSFVAGETISVALTGAGRATLAAAHAGTVAIAKTATDTGSVSIDIALPARAAGSYTVVATGLSSATVGAATIVVGAYSAEPQAVPAETPVEPAEQTEEQTAEQLADTGSTQVVTAASIAIHGTDAPGGTAVVSFAEKAFAPNEDVVFAVVGSGSATLSVVRAASVSLVATADADGSVGLTVTLPADAAGEYTVSAQGLSSKTVANTTITVGAGEIVAAGTTSVRNPIGFGSITPLLWFWIAGGLAMLTAGMVAVYRVQHPKPVS